MLHLQFNFTLIRKYFPYLLLLLLLAPGCSPKKNTGFSRFWHKLNTRFNGYFNGNEAIKEGVAGLSATRKDNFNTIIPVYHYGAKENWQNMSTQSDRALKKAVVMIQKHSMLINGQQYNKWIDDCYMLMGKANYFKLELYIAVAQLRYVADNSEKESTKTEALIWMMKAYNTLGEFPDASTILNRLKNRQIPDKLREEYAATVSEYYILKEYYDLALKSLEEAVKYAKPKRRKARYQFIIGQIMQQQGNDTAAYVAFAKTLKLKPEYEIEFQSKINMARTAGDLDNDGLRKVLRKMLKDDKNIDYLDQIYYALGVIDLKEEKKTEAIDNFRLSLKNALPTSTQKPITYLVLAELYFKDKNYELAQAYYDSCGVTIDKSHPKYEEVQRLKENLALVVSNIKMVALQDSLQRLGKMNPDDLQIFLEQYIEDLKIKDEEAKKNPGGGVTSPGGNPFNSGGAIISYWYNEQAKAFGSSEFKKTWGDRPLEDDWRRSNKTSTGFVDAPEDTAGEDNNPRYMVETYLAEIPDTEEEVAASNDLIYDALYNLGVVYKENIRDIPNAIEAFLELERRNTENKHFPLTYYQLYLSYNSLGDKAKAEFYKNLILEKYPESEYAQILTNPEAFAIKDKQNDEAEPFYRATYDLFNRGDYYGTMANSRIADSLYNQSSLLHRFALLRSLSIGKTDSLDVFIAALKEVTEKYAGTESAETAQRLLDMLKKDSKTTDNADKPVIDTTQVVDVKPKTPWESQKDADHFVLILIPDKAINLNDAKNLLASFNDENYGTKGYTVTNAILGNYSMLSIRKFASGDEALNYRTTLLAKGLEEKMKLGPEVKTVAVNAKNFTLLFKTQDISGYYEFFLSEYSPD